MYRFGWYVPISPITTMPLIRKTTNIVERMAPTINIAQEIYLAIMISFRLTGKLFIIMSLLFLSSQG